MKRYALALAVLLCIAVSAWCFTQPPILFAKDAVHYLSLGTALARGEGYHSGIYLVHDLLQPPLYPLLIALLVKLGSPPVGAAVVIVIAAQAATVVALAGIHRVTFGGGMMFTALAAALSANLALGTSLTLEPLFVCALAWGFRLAVESLDRDHLSRAAGAGLAFGVALLTRSEVIITLTIAIGLFVFWPSSWRRRLLRLAALLGAFAAVALPYGLWMRAHLGHFEILPKVSYNRRVPSLVDHMQVPPNAGEDAAVAIAMVSLMPDHRIFVLDYAFEHPEFDPRTQLPQRTEAHGWLSPRTAALAGRRLLAHAMVRLGFLNPLALFLMLFGACCAMRGSTDAPWKRRLLVLALGGAAALHLLPALLSLEDFQERYVSAAIAFFTPFIGAGAAALAVVLGRRMRGAQVLAGVLLVAMQGFFVVRSARHQASGPPRWAHLRAVEAACRRSLPAGARVLDPHPRNAWLAGGKSFTMPWAHDLAELTAYLAAWRVDHAVLDGRALAESPNPFDREVLLDPRLWPPSWHLVEELPDAGPTRIVRMDR
jgi:hypothetical protein